MWVGRFRKQCPARSLGIEIHILWKKSSNFLRGFSRKMETSLPSASSGATVYSNIVSPSPSSWVWQLGLNVNATLWELPHERCDHLLFLLHEFCPSTLSNLLFVLISSSLISVSPRLLSLQKSLSSFSVPCELTPFPASSILAKQSCGVAMSELSVVIVFFLTPGWSPCLSKVIWPVLVLFGMRTSHKSPVHQRSNTESERSTPTFKTYRQLRETCWVNLHVLALWEEGGAPASTVRTCRVHWETALKR